MNLNRQKVSFDDPLSFLSAVDSLDPHDKDVHYINEETDFRTIDLEKVQFGTKKKKEKVVSQSVEKEAPSSLSTFPSQGPPSAVLPSIGPTATNTPHSKFTEKVDEEEDEDIFLVKTQNTTQDESDIFKIDKNLEIRSATQTNTYQIKPIPSTKEDDDVSDLNVAKLLEREEQLDFNMFGKVSSATEKQKIAKKKMDLDQESDFLKQLDEITISSSKRLSNSTSSLIGTSRSSDTANKTSIAPTTVVDLNALNLDEYISQHASSGGGLFDD